MPDSALGKIRNDVLASPATDRLKEELRNYLLARAEHTVTGLGRRLGEGVTKLARPGDGAGGPLKSLAKGGRALAEGRSPAQAAMTAGASHLKETVKDRVKRLFGKGRKPGGGKSKSVTIVEDIDVGVPVREAYDQWTQFQEFSTFAKGVVSVEKADDTTSNWKVKVAKSTRSWRADVTEQVPDERITWTTEGAKGTVKGVVTFHAVTADLTKVLLVLEYFPKGLFEKTGNIWRAQGRRARLDLKLFRKFIMMRGEATDGWRGEIRDGEVTVTHDDAVEREQTEEQERTAEQEQSGVQEQADPEYGDADAAHAGAEDELPADDGTDEPDDEDDAEGYEDEFTDEGEEPYEDDEPEGYEGYDEEGESGDRAEDDEPEHDDEPAPHASRRRRHADARA